MHEIDAGGQTVEKTMESVARTVGAIDRRLVPLLRRIAVPVLRVSLGVVFVWFGVLKIFDVTPVTELVGNTVYWFDPDWVVPALGVVEVAVGLGLVFRRFLRTVLAVLVGQLVGTFLVFVIVPGVAFQDGNPLLLTVEGEFVVKNLVLIAAGFVVGTRVGHPTERI